MAIVGSFIVNRLETAQLEKVTVDTKNTLTSIINSSTYLSESKWEDSSERIQNTLDEWRLDSTESIYAIAEGGIARIVASTVNTQDSIQGANAYAYGEFNTQNVIDGLAGQTVYNIKQDPNTQARNLHYVIPVHSKDGSVQGILYMITDLSLIYNTIASAKSILSSATLVAIIVTSILGYVLASSITGPISDVTTKAQEMAEGDFNQKVDVKSNDEIGRLGSMFNYLTMELEATIAEMDIERSKLDIIFNYMVEGLIAVDRNNQLIHANPVARDLLGIDLEELEAEETWDLEQLNITDINYFSPDTLSGISQIEIEDSFFNVRYAPFKNESGQYGGIIVVLQDITKEHNLDIMRKEFVANVSHELKTPITTIKSYTETLMAREMDHEVELRFLNIINRETDRMSHLVRDLLQLSNMDANRTKWNIVTIDPYEWVEPILEGLQPQAKEKNHKLILDIPEYIKPFLADEHGANQVLVNVVSNAIKYTTYGGRIVVKAKNFGTRVHIEVTDDGIGIPKRDLDRIFERFYRVEKGRSRVSGGTGLGLAIAKEVMESMDARILIKSEYGVGTTVTLSFPMDQEAV